MTSDRFLALRNSALNVVSGKNNRGKNIVILESSVKWSVLAHFKSQFPWSKFSSPNLVERSSPPYTRPNKKYQ